MYRLPGGEALETLPDTPSFNQWIALIQRDAEQAKQHALRLHYQASSYGPLAPAELSSSLANYEAAVRLIEAAAGDPEKAADVERRAELGAVGDAPYPDERTWAELLAADPGRARKMFFELELKAAQLGIRTPAALRASLETFRALTAS